MFGVPCLMDAADNATRSATLGNSLSMVSDPEGGIFEARVQWQKRVGLGTGSLVAR